jgi:hypothetical protein
MGTVVNNRLEASTRGTDLLPGLHARVHDPLWLLARQWQLGELDGRDAGTPVQGALVTRAVPLAAWRPALTGPAGGADDAGAADGAQATVALPYDGNAPLEALVESDESPLSWRERVSAGLRLVRALRRASVDPAALIAAYPLAVPDAAADPDVDPAAHATSAVTPGEVAAVGAVTAKRVPDPDAVAAAFDGDQAALVNAIGAAAAGPVLQAWRTWWDSRQPRTSGAWQADQLSYALEAWTADAALPGYTGERFPGGALDWTAFDVTPPGPIPGRPADTSTSSPGSATPGSMTAVTAAIPVPVTFHGSPVGRYWQLDDASTDLGAIDTFPTELGKLLLAEFTACFAGDWYRLPVRVPYGSATHVDALVSTDTFGIATLVPAATAVTGDRPWRMFEHSVATKPDGQPVGAADGSWLLVPPVLAGSLDSPPAEEVAYARDVAADLAWGIEDTVTNAVGRPVRRSEDLRAQGRGAAPDPREGLADAWVWRLATTVPENWIPLLPTRGRAAGDDYLLVQGAMIRYTRDAGGNLTAVPVLPAGLLLRARGTLPEREVPREGRTLRRLYRLARWTDGSRVLWSARQSSVGHGQASSGLAYDGLHVTSDTAAALGQ